MASAPISRPAARAGVTYFEDVVIDLPLETPGITITEAHVGLYTGVSEDRAREPQLVPTLLPLCLSSGLGWRMPQPPLVVLAFMGFELRSRAEVRIGDTIHSRSRTVAKRSMREGGVVVEERDIMNQHGEVVQTCRLTLLVARRPAA